MLPHASVPSCAVPHHACRAAGAGCGVRAPGGGTVQRPVVGLQFGRRLHVARGHQQRRPGQQHRRQPLDQLHPGQPLHERPERLLRAGGLQFRRRDRQRRPQLPEPAGGDGLGPRGRQAATLAVLRAAHPQAQLADRAADPQQPLRGDPHAHHGGQQHRRRAHGQPAGRRRQQAIRRRLVLHQAGALEKRLGPRHDQRHGGRRAEPGGNAVDRQSAGHELPRTLPDRG